MVSRLVHTHLFDCQTSTRIPCSSDDVASRPRSRFAPSGAVRFTGLLNPARGPGPPARRSIDCRCALVGHPFGNRSRDPSPPTSADSLTPPSPPGFHSVVFPTNRSDTSFLPFGQARFQHPGCDPFRCLRRTTVPSAYNLEKPGPDPEGIVKSCLPSAVRRNITLRLRFVSQRHDALVTSTKML